MNKYAGLLMISFILIPAWSFAANVNSEVPFTRSITKIYTVSSGAQLSIENKYGNVTLHSWNKDEIKAVINIRVEGNTLENARQLADQVSIRSKQSGNLVSFQTQYDANSGTSFWKQFFGSGSKGGKKYVHIDYEVYIPRSIAGTTIKNDYGNLTCDPISGDLYVAMNYGNFRIGNLGGRLNLNTNYCTGSLTDIKDGEVHSNYTDFNLDKVQSLQISYNYSDFKIMQSGNIKVQGNYGNISGETITYLGSKTTYSDYKINKLSEGGNINTTYGDIYIKMLGDQFKGLIVKPTYSDVKIGIPDGLLFQLDIGLTRGDIRTDNIHLQTTEKVEDHGNSTLKAYAKGAGSNAPMLRIIGAYSDVTLSQK